MFDRRKNMTIGGCVQIAKNNIKKLVDGFLFWGSARFFQRAFKRSTDLLCTVSERQLPCVPRNTPSLDFGDARLTPNRWTRLHTLKQWTERDSGSMLGA